MQAPLLQIDGISKAFPGVQALKAVSFDVYPGQILALIGENGAGKSTLMKILNGVYQPDDGQLVWEGQPVTIHSPHEAQMLGISMIHQELALIPYLDAGKNIYLGREPRGRLPGTINWRRLYADAEAQLARIGLRIDPRAAVNTLPIAQQQMVEVAKALSLNAKLIIMDEPTSSLTDRETELLFAQMRALRDAGVAVIFISHRLDEVFTICDRVVVLRDGALVGDQPISALDHDQVIRLMVGREVHMRFEPRPRREGSEPVMRVQHLSRGSVLRDISFDLYPGEILGIAGLVGAGRTELVRAIFGADPATHGQVWIGGRWVRFSHPDQAIRNNIGLVPEDRKGQGLFLSMTVATNIIMTLLWRLATLGLIRWEKATQMAMEYRQRLDIRTPSVHQRVGRLSGGNQQKVVIAKWLTRKPRVLILDEPTRGIDVGAKAEIHNLMRELTDAGIGVIMISSELPEILGVSDRILVMRGGQLVGEFDPRTATQDQIIRAATGAAEVVNEP